MSKNRDVGDVNPLKPLLFWQTHSVGSKQCLRECGRVETLWTPGRLADANRDPVM